MSTRRFVVTVFLVMCQARCWAETSIEELARLLRDKQIITVPEYDGIVNAGGAGTVGQLAQLLRNKGLITATEAAGLSVAAGTPASPVTTPEGAVSDHQSKSAESSSGTDTKFKFYGTLLFNAYFNDQASNNADIPGFASPKTAGPQNNFGATARQT